MKAPRVLFYVVLLAIILLSVFVLIEHKKQTGKSNLEQMTSTRGNFNPTMNQISTNSNAQISFGKIISDTTTSSNRIVVAEKDGVQKTAFIPLTMASLTDDQILYSLFATNSPPKKSNVTPNQHLAFYGLTVDDETNALAGVTISGGVLVVDGKNPGHNVQVETVSDANGRFQIDVDYGQLIWLTASKGTNYISQPSREFKYGAMDYGPMDAEKISNPSINDPIFFVLTKKKEAEPLIEIRKGVTAPNTGEPVRIDLTTGQIVPSGGDLIVSITCPEPFKAGVHTSWKIILQATDGGFVSTDTQRLEYMLEAPESGYDEVVIDHPKDDPNWDSQYNGTLYMKSRNGQIRGKLTFYTNNEWDERGAAFLFHSFVNTNGSRNLQNVSF